MEMLQKEPGTVVCICVISYFRINQAEYIYAYLYTCIKQTYIIIFKKFKDKKEKIRDVFILLYVYGYFANVCVCCLLLRQELMHSWLN